MSVEMEVVENTLPDYINYLLAPDTPLDYKISVGDPETCTPETFGVVKWLLVARSRVLRSMILESKMKHEHTFNIADLDPVTFKNFLVFMYGFNNTASLPFEEAVKLLNVAEKYDVPDLMASLGDVIRARVTPENVFAVLRSAPVCEKVPALWSCVAEIIQQHTQKLFSHEEFLTASPEVVVHIVQQDWLSVSELDVWRAVLRWTTHRVSSLGGVTSPKSLRSTMLPLLKHTRLCTLSSEQLCREVVPTRVLTDEEIGLICLSIGKQEKSNSLLQICNEIEKRHWSKPQNTKDYMLCCCVKTFKIDEGTSSGKTCGSKFYLITKANDIELRGVVCEANRYIELADKFVPADPSYQCEATVRITRVTDYRDNSSTEPPVQVTFSEQVQYGTDLTIPLLLDSSWLVLKANSKYTFEFEFSREHKVVTWNAQPFMRVQSSDDFLIVSDRKKRSSYDSRSNNEYINISNHMKALHYNVIGI